MRCYFMKGRKIRAVRLLTKGPDGALIQQADALFKAVDLTYDGYEVRDGARFVHRYPPDLPQPSSPAIAQ